MEATSNILAAFEDFRMPPIPGDQYDQMGRHALADKVRPFVERGEPIRFTMLGFPMKSNNDRDKVLGVLPDLGEEVALAQFAALDTRIREHYAPGAQFRIVSDGYAFNDVLGTPDDTVARYTDQVRELAPWSVELLDINTFYGPGSLAGKREKLVEQFGITPEELERRIMFDPDVNSLYRGMMRSMFEDTAILPFPSNSQHQKEAKRLAREMMLRNEAYSALVRHEMGDHIRLSMHPSLNNGTKYSFALVPGPLAKHSPWHCAIAIHPDGTMETIHRKEAEQRGYDLQMRNGRPYNFQA